MPEKVVIDGMRMDKTMALDYKIRLAKQEVQELFCDHLPKHQKREMLEQSNERITCLACGKVWYD